MADHAVDKLSASRWSAFAWKGRAVQPTVLALAAIGTAFYVVRFWTVYAAGELFHRLGFDWTMFWAQAMVVRAGDAPDMYDFSGDGPVTRQLQVLSQFYTGSGKFQFALPVAYPPWFAALFLPFTFPSPPIGFLLWSALSFACGVWLVVRFKQMLPSVPLLGAAVLIFGAYPVALGLFMGQVVLIMGVAVAEMFVSFRAGRDFRAGLWLAVLLLKPQYAVLFGLLILWKWRVRGLLGAALGTIALFVLGLIVVGFPAFLRISDSAGDFADFRSEHAAPLLMINWRALVLYALPWIASNQGVILVAVLSIATVIVLFAFWQGPWNAAAPEFSTRFAAVALGSLVTSYHSHVHGIALMMVPLAAAWAQPVFSTKTRVALLAAVYLPTLLLVWTGGVVERFAVSAAGDLSLWYAWPDGVPVLLFMTAFVLVCRDMWRAEQPRLHLTALTMMKSPMAVNNTALTRLRRVGLIRRAN
ncbi:MAG: DUF2029 domain-containing protein [Chloroflexi bacterium]|nr:DUF2029 domain-containing protein [Chloroflexota bacterium]